jgi:exosortase/archaeosortase family protein
MASSTADDRSTTPLQGAESEPEPPAWALVKAGLPILLFAIIAAGPVHRVWYRWTGENDYYSHGPLIPFVSLYLLLRMRKRLTGEDPPELGALYAGGVGAGVLYWLFSNSEWDKRYLFGILAVAATGYVVYQLRKFKPRPWKPGLLVFLPALILGTIASVHEIVSVAWFFVVVMAIGLVLYYLGKRFALLAAFPLAFLFSSVPMPEFVVQRVTLPLKQMATKNTHVIVKDGLRKYCRRDGNAIEFPPRVIEEDGKRIEVPEKRVLVGAECSGLRSLIALISFGLLFAYITPLSLGKKLVLFVATIPASFIANLFRILALTLVTYYWDEKVATGGKLWDNVEAIGWLEWLAPHGRDLSNEPIHDFTGIMIFVVAFIALFSLERVLLRVENWQQRRREEREEREAATGNDAAAEPAAEAGNA